MEELQNNTSGSELESLKLYTGKAPLLLQIIGGLMWLEGLAMILQGILSILFFGLGIILIIFGFFNIKYARAIFKMQIKGYKGALVLQCIMIVAAIIFWGVSGFTTINEDAIGGILYALIISGILYLYRNRFINE